MTRKKFIKMLQARGMSRNKAGRVAKVARRQRLPYFKALGEWETYCSLLRYNRTHGGLYYWRCNTLNMVEVIDA